MLYAVAMGWPWIALLGVLASDGEPGPLQLDPPQLLARSEGAPSAAHLDASHPTHEQPEPSWGVPLAHSAGLMVGMRLGAAWLWPEPFARTDVSGWLENYQTAFTSAPYWDGSQRAFEWDGDAWWINVVGHGLFGSELHYRTRRCGHSVLTALAFTTAASAVWEYAFEANEVRPSALDLWFTPLSGLVLGEARYLMYREAGKLRGGLRHVVRGVLDPLGELERGLGAPC